MNSLRAPYLIFLIVLTVTVTSYTQENTPPEIIKMKLVEKRMVKFRSLDGSGYSYISEDGQSQYYPKNSIAELDNDIQYSFTL